MRKDLMEAEELRDRYKPELALDLALEKLTRIRLAENWRELIRPDWSVYFDGDTCALCTRYKVISEDEDTWEVCTTCPLKPDHRKTGCGSESSWGAATTAMMYPVDRPSFMKHTLDMIRKIELAIEKRDNERTEND